jgi:putative membrane protein
MIGFIIRTIVIAIGVAAVAYVYPAISYGDDPTTLAVVALILGLLNAFVKPIIKIFSLPLTIMTLGLFGIVINAGLLIVVAFIADIAGFDFVVGGFPPDFGISTVVAAVVGAIGISIVGTIVGMVVPD